MKRTILALTLTLMLSSVTLAGAKDDASFKTPQNMYLAASPGTGSNPQNNVPCQPPQNNLLGALTIDMVLGLLNFGL